MKWAFETLNRYRKKFCMFNDDIQVTCVQIHILLLWHKVHHRKCLFKVHPLADFLMLTLTNYREQLELHWLGYLVQLRHRENH